MKIRSRRITGARLLSPAVAQVHAASMRLGRGCEFAFSHAALRDALAAADGRGVARRV
jgi:hypothetical protein